MSQSLSVIHVSFDADGMATKDGGGGGSSGGGGDDEEIDGFAIVIDGEGDIVCIVFKLQKLCT